MCVCVCLFVCLCVRACVRGCVCVRACFFLFFSRFFSFLLFFFSFFPFFERVKGCFFLFRYSDRTSHPGNVHTNIVGVSPLRDRDIKACGGHAAYRYMDSSGAALVYGVDVDHT